MIESQKIILKSIQIQIIIMSVFKSKSINIAILTCYSLTKKDPISYVSALVLPLIPINRPIITTILTLLSLIPNLITIDLLSIILMIVVVAVHVIFHGLPWKHSIQQKHISKLSSKYLIFIYLFSFSFLSITEFKLSHHIYLVLLFAMLLIYSVNAKPNIYINYVILVSCYLSVVWGTLIFITDHSQIKMLHNLKFWSSQQWWYYATLAISNWFGIILTYQINFQSNSQLNVQSHQQKDLKSNPDIQMRQFSRNSKQKEKRFHSNQTQNRESKRNRLPSLPSQEHQQQNHNKQLMERLLQPLDEMNLNKHRSKIQSEDKQKYQIKLSQNLRPKTSFQFNRNRIGSASEEIKNSQINQEQIINLFLLIPFTLFQPGFLHIPIYFYLIWLQNGTTPMWVFYSMFVSVCALTIWEDTATFKLQIVLRLCLILIVNKNYNAAVSITRVLRSVWLRSSFVFVLLILFWFSLLTVNLFHISFVLIVLLFITKNNKSQSQQHSFRHKNWRYLVYLFNLFLVLRLLWLILNTDFKLKLSDKVTDVLSIIGITYNYGLSWSYFNMIPLLVSGVLTVQYWTYSSRIYNLESKKTLIFLPTYRALILKILQILTIIYYKLIPWASHFFVIIIIISLQFSLIADTVLIISLLILMIHMIRPNQLSSYRLMQRMWNIFLKVVSIQIILRYIFEFIKFPLIFTHISQFPVIKTLIKYQQLLGLAIRQSSNSYLKNTFTKFQLMMILDFSIIAVCFVTLQYYDIMIKYFQLEQQKQIQLKLIKSNNQGDQQIMSQQSQQNHIIRQNSTKLTNHDAKYIYEHFIDFKITMWLSHWNQYMLGFSNFYLKIYYPFIGTYSSLYYSYATFIYFLSCVYYYLKINLKFYQVYALKEFQSRIMNLFHLWRKKNNIRVNLVQKSPIRTSNIIKQAESMQFQHGFPQKPQKLKENEQSQFPPLVASTQNPTSLYLSLKKQIIVTNARVLFDNFINLHTRLRFWIIIFTLCFIVLNYSSRVFVSGQLKDFIQPNTNEDIRYFLFMCGTSKESPININIYLLIIGLTVIQIKCCSLISKIGRPVAFHESQQKQQKNNLIKFNTLQNVQIQHQEQHQFQKKKQTSAIYQSNEIKKFVDVSISLRLGINKIAQRFFVILLVFVSLLENQSPFSIIYLVWAWFLNYMGTRSMQALSITLSILVILQYSLIITDTTNKYLGVKELFPDRVHYSWLIELLNIQDQQWIEYLSFGRKVSQIVVMYLSLSILILYQACFYLQQNNWVHVLDKMFEKITIGGIYLKFYQKISQIYEYALVYSPLFIITLCLGLYLMDFTATNMFLSILSIIFLFKSFLVQNYTNSRPFWKSYFRILQFLIMIFMAVYCVLSTPMYNHYCNKFLCSPEEFRTKITKTILLLILQLGIDIISSHHFKNAMDTLQNTLNQTSSYYKIAISIVQNDKKIQKQFQSVRKKQNIKKNIGRLRDFLSSYQNDPTVKYEYNKQPQAPSQPWLETILNFMPSFIDSSLIRSPQQTRLFVKEQNKNFIKWLQQQYHHKLGQQEIKIINKKYDDQFSDFKSHQQLIQRLNNIIQIKKEQEKKVTQQSQANNLGFSRRQLKRQKKILLDEQQIEQRRKKSNIKRQQLDKLQQRDEDISHQSSSNIRKSYIQGKLPFQQDMDIHHYSTYRKLSFNKQQIAVPIQEVKQQQDQIQQANKEQKKKLLYLKIFQSVVSNWHYLTYLLMIMQFIINMGILTLPFPFITFLLGIVYSYQAPKNVWRLAFLALLPPIFFKYSLQIQLVKPGQVMQFVLIGSNNTSILVQFLLMFFIVIQCLILKIAGLYDECTAEVQCMNIALIRNIINVQQNNKTKHQQRQTFFNLLQKSRQVSKTFFEYLFSIYECKTGYDYSTLMVTIQLVILFYIFTFYDRMAVRQQLTFYKMIQYNQFTTGMVVMAFLQLGFMLLQRIMAVLQLTYKKWDVTLIIKYAVLAVSLIYVHGMVLAFFPINANYFGPNNYIFIFYVLNIFYFLISALQIKGGLNKQSRGFLDRYSWYNGYIYMTYRAIPFLFQFKIFSDWTFTTTSLRLFDWIKYQQILGYVYVAKCNSLFLKGKILGSKIQWWKKLLMGFPLLLTIILLLFGPLILFSSLNPLSSLNEITGGHLQLALKINKTNQYPFYINTHITDISFLNKEPDQQTSLIIKTYQLDPKSIQIVHLEPFSDQYWEISQGSYNKLIQQPQGSLYQLTMRVKFDRNQTKTTPIYVLNTYTIPEERVNQFKQTLKSRASFKIQNFVPAFMRLDNNNGLHFLTDEYLSLQFHAEESRTLKKKYWVINDGITFRMASDKYSKAIFGYSVMSFYISIILVVANYFRFLFQGSAYTIIMSDIPYADPILSVCDGIHQARLRRDIYQQQMLFWTLIDIIRSPDLMKAITGNYLNARMQTLKNVQQVDQEVKKKSKKDE